MEEIIKEMNETLKKLLEEVKEVAAKQSLTRRFPHNIDVLFSCSLYYIHLSVSSISVSSAVVLYHKYFSSFLTLFHPLFPNMLLSPVDI